MELKIEGNCYVHNLLFVDDQAVITRRTEDTNYMGRKLEEYEKCRLKLNYGKNKIFSWRSFRGTENQWK
jgi:hypothetical protein